MDLGKGTRGLEKLHWDAGLSLRGIGDCLLGWVRSNGDLNLGSSRDGGNRNLDWSNLSLDSGMDPGSGEGNSHSLESYFLER